MRKPFAIIASFALLAAGIAGSPAAAQTDAEYLSAVNFRFGNPGARARGLGGAFVALADDATAAVVNPAGLAYLEHSEASIQFESDENEFPASRLETGSAFRGGEVFPEYPARRGRVETEQEVLSFASWTMPLKKASERPFAIGVFYSKPLDTSAGGDPDAPAVQTGAATFPNIEPGWFFFPVASFVEAKNEAAGLTAGWRISDRFSIGGSLGVSRFDLSGVALRTHPRTGGLESAQASVVDSENALFATVGALWRIHDRFTVGGSWQKETRYDMDNFSASANSPDRFFSSKFTIPTRWAFGIAYRPASGWVIAAEADRIEYSDLFEQSKEVSFFTDGSDDYAFLIDDVTELHLGAEYSRQIHGWIWSFRAGAWRDRTHPSYFAGSNPLLAAWAPRLTEDVDHFTAGIGFDSGRIAFDLAADISSDAGNDFLASFVFRPGRKNS